MCCKGNFKVYRKMQKKKQTTKQEQIQQSSSPTRRNGGNESLRFFFTTSYDWDSDIMVQFVHRNRARLSFRVKWGSINYVQFYFTISLFISPQTPKTMREQLLIYTIKNGPFSVTVFVSFLNKQDEPARVSVNFGKCAVGNCIHKRGRGFNH